MKCVKCRYWASSAKPGAGAEVSGVDATRERNFLAICSTLKNKFPHCKTVLDVGCSRGLFLKIADREGFCVTGIEPDPALAAEARAQGFEVLNGFFPEAKELEGRRFDVVIFNDSFEHMPDLQLVTGGIKTHLTPGGVAALNLPSSDGLMFTLASFLNDCGVSAPFDRLWQKGFASPHLHYFNPRNLRALFEREGFAETARAKVHYYVLKGLWTRITCKSSFVTALAVWPVLAALYPIFSAKSDCCASFFVQEKL